MSFCNLCGESLLIKTEVQLTSLQQQRLRFFNASHRGQVHDIVTINGDRGTCIHKFHLYCIVHFHSNYYSEDVVNELGDKEIFPCPATGCPVYFTGSNGFHVTPYNEFTRLFSPEDPRLPTFDRSEVVDLSNDFNSGRTNIWEWTEPAKLEPLDSFSTQNGRTNIWEWTDPAKLEPLDSFSAQSETTGASSSTTHTGHSSSYSFPACHCSTAHNDLNYTPTGHSVNGGQSSIPHNGLNYATPTGHSVNGRQSSIPHNGLNYATPTGHSVNGRQSSILHNGLNYATPTGHNSSVHADHSSAAPTDHVAPPVDDDYDLIELINSLQSVDLDEALGFKVEDTQANENTYAEDGLMEVDTDEDTQADPVADYIRQMNLSPVSPPASYTTTSVASPPSSPTLSQASTVPIDPNFRIVGQMLRHMEDRHLHSIGWTPSTTIHRAHSDIFVQFLHGFPLNPQIDTVDTVLEPNSTPEEFLQDVRDHMTDVMWTNSDFEPYVSIYRVNVRHVLGIFAAIPRGLPMQCQPISWPQKEYIFSITTIIPYLRSGTS